MTATSRATGSAGEATNEESGAAAPFVPSADRPVWKQPSAADHGASRGLLALLDHIDIGIVLLDAGMRAEFMNRQFRDMWGISEPMMERRPSLHDLATHVETTLWRSMAKPERQADIRRREREVRNGSVAPSQIDMPDGRYLRFCCQALADGRRLLTYVDITDVVRRGTDAAMEHVGAELRFATETLETQAAYLASLAEETEETRKQADLARQMLEREIEERQKIEEQLRHVASTDGLTGVLNRAAFLASAKQDLARAHRIGQPLALLMLDADHFKAVNDRYGHAGGDEVLRSLARDCQLTMRSGDSVGRIGGEEFAILLPGATLKDGERVAERLCKVIAGHPVSHHEDAIFYTVSIGVAVVRPGDRSIEQVVARADAALYEAKALGRNRVVMEGVD